LPRPTSPVNEPNDPFHKTLTAKDVTSPAFIEKVVEILNGDNEKTEIVQAAPLNVNRSPNQPNQQLQQAPNQPNQLLQQAPNQQNQLLQVPNQQNQQFQAPFQPQRPLTNQPNLPVSPPPGMPSLNGAPKPQNIPMIPFMGPEGIEIVFRVFV